MIYILAPYNILINTTAKNRILSYYRSLKKENLRVTIINPPILQRDPEFRAKGLSNTSTAFEDVVDLELKESVLDKLFSSIVPDKHQQKGAAGINALHLLSKGYDFYYPIKSLKYFFKQQSPSSEDVIIASGFPYSLFKAGADLAREYNCKLILDYRDPWTFSYIALDSLPLINKVKNLLQRTTEEKCLAIANMAVCDSESVKKLFPIKFRKKIEVILNGANLDVIDPKQIISRPDKFRIVYLGTIYNDQLADETFFSALSQLVHDNQIADQALELAFVGSQSNPNLSVLIRKYNLQAFCKITPRLSLADAMTIGYSASAFLHLKYGNRTAVDSSKQLDYLALQKPILLPITDNGNAAESIIGNSAGYVCNSQKECYDALQDLWRKQQNAEDMRIYRTDEFLYSISRDAEAEKLIKIIKNIS